MHEVIYRRCLSLLSTLLPLLSSAHGLVAVDQVGASSKAREERVAHMKQEVAEEELAMMGCAIEEYSIAHNVYPSSNGTVVLVTTLSTVLTPTYLSHIPNRDPLGGHYLFWSDGQGYLLVSTGADDKPDVDYDALLHRPFSEIKDQICRGARDHLNDDLVWKNGQICSWPTHRQGG